MRPLLFALLALYITAINALTAPSDDRFTAAIAAYKNKSFVEAFQLFQPLAEGGNASAQYNLGLMLANGKGVAKNEAEAVKWYRKAAEQGNASAQYNLGVMLANGKGVAQNEAEAVKWYRKAAEQGHGDAQSNLGVMYLNGDGGLLQDDLQAFAMFRKAAVIGNEYAFFNLGRMYKNGRGVARNDVLAYAYLNLAAGNGHSSAATMRDEVFSTLKPAQVKEGQSLSSNWKLGQPLPVRTTTWSEKALLPVAKPNPAPTVKSAVKPVGGLAKAQSLVY